MEIERKKNSATLKYDHSRSWNHLDLNSFFLFLSCQLPIAAQLSFFFLCYRRLLHWGSVIFNFSFIYSLFLLCAHTHKRGKSFSSASVARTYPPAFIQHHKVRPHARTNLACAQKKHSRSVSALEGLGFGVLSCCSVC